MKLTIAYQDRYSRAQLLLRTVFGWLYIGVPHALLLLVVGIWSVIRAFVAFWVILFTGHFPRGIFDWQLEYLNWGLRVIAVFSNLVDGWAEFFPGGTSEKVRLDVEYPPRAEWWSVLLRGLFGPVYAGIPHGIYLIGRLAVSIVLAFLAWWAVLITEEYPKAWHAFNVGTLRMFYRLLLYLGFFTNEYPPFTGREYPGEAADGRTATPKLI